MRIKSILLAGVALTAFPAVGFAQSNAENNRPAVEEIVVTAQKRAENLQRVPIAVTAVTSKSIENMRISSTTDLGAVMPGLRTGNSAGAGLFFLRGVGQTSGAPGIVSPIATYLDGVYIGIARLSLFDLNGIEQISLLRGPQGSLFGRNAAGGLVQVTTKDPSSEAFGNMALGYANYDTFNGSVYANGPITDKLSANISLKGRDETTGWIHNVATGHDILKEKQYSAQAKLLWKPSDVTSVTANMIYQYAAHLPGTAGEPTPGYLAIDGVTRFLGPQTVDNRTDGDNKTITRLASLRINHDLDWVRISNLAHGIWSEPKFLVGQSGIPGRPNPNNQPEQSSNLNSEIRAYGDDFQISSPEGDDLQWIAGLSYEYELTRSVFTVLLDQVRAQQIDSRYTSEAYAGFLQATKTIFEDTRLTGGVRYTNDKLALSGRTSTGLTPAIGGLPPSKTFKKVTWRASIDHSLTPDVLLYASANRGFKAGQYSIVAFTNQPVKPETVTAYETGFKSQLFDHRLRLNVSGFYQDMQNLQLRALNGATVALFNAASARSYGIDADFEAAVTNELTINGGLEWLPHANYRSFPGAMSSRTTPIAAAPPGCTGAPNARVGGYASFVCDLSGNRMVMAPKLAMNIGFQYTVETSVGAFSLNVADSHSSKVFVDSDHTTSAEPYDLVSASINYQLPGERWNIRVWGTNLANDRTYFNAQYIYLPGEPRRYGVEVGVKF